MRYGENPHQSGVFYGDLKKLFDQLNGKELSYNNLVDVDAAIQLIREFGHLQTSPIREDLANSQGQLVDDSAQSGKSIISKTSKSEASALVAPDKSEIRKRPSLQSLNIPMSAALLSVLLSKKAGMLPWPVILKVLLVAYW